MFAQPCKYTQCRKHKNQQKEALYKTVLGYCVCIIYQV